MGNADKPRIIMLTLSTGINSTVSYAKSAKSCPYFSLFFSNLPFHRENSGKGAYLSRCHAKFSLPSRPQTHNEIYRRKEQIVLQKVLSDTAIPRLARMKQPLLCFLHKIEAAARLFRATAPFYTVWENQSLSEYQNGSRRRTAQFSPSFGPGARRPFWTRRNCSPMRI